MKPGPTAGLGLKPQHYADALASTAAGLWFEVHPENYMCAGGPRLVWLEAIRAERPLSLHGVGLSLAADEAPDPDHLKALRQLADRFEPFMISEHLAWSQRGGIYRPDLLPFPRSRAALERVRANVSRMQDGLGQRVLIENPSLYLPLTGHDFGEVEFLTELVRRTGCGLLVDVNNIYVSAHNLDFSAEDYVDAIPAEAVGEIHLAGHSRDQRGGEQLLIDSHDAPVAEAVWRLYQRLILRVGAAPTLIERDGNVPTFSELAVERNRADRLLRRSAERALEVTVA